MTELPGTQLRESFEAGCPSDADAEPGNLRVLELQHRIKNLLTIVQSLVNLTLRDGVTLAEARHALNGRLAAMAGAIACFTGEGPAPATLEELLHRTLGQAGSDRLSLSGPDVIVGPESVLTLSLAFHELESNAIKYGALTRSQGLITVRWSVRGDQLRLEWLEQGGPPVQAPATQGFGSRLIERATASRLSGRCSLAFDPSGIRYSLEAPLDQLAR